MKLLAIVFIAMILIGCANVPLVSVPPSSNSAVLRLLDSAESAEVDGNFDRAIADLERALRIEPDNAHVWYQLADAHYQQGNKSEAKSLAKRALTYAKDARLKKSIQLLLNSL